MASSRQCSAYPLRRANGCLRALRVDNRGRCALVSRNPKRLTVACESADIGPTNDLCRLIRCAMVGLVRSRAALQVEILVLRHQLNVLRRQSPRRVAIANINRPLFVGLYRFSPKVLNARKSSSWGRWTAIHFVPAPLCARSALPLKIRESRSWRSQSEGPATPATVPRARPRQRCASPRGALRPLRAAKDVRRGDGRAPIPNCPAQPFPNMPFISHHKYRSQGTSGRPPSAKPVRHRTFEHGQVTKDNQQCSG